MPNIYSQLRVSCGLSATINAAQPEDLKISAKESFAHWLDVQWLRLTHKEDPLNPLTRLCTRREWKWVAVLDYILLRKIRSSFLLCQGVPAGALTLEVEEQDLNWNVLTPFIIKILTHLNDATEDWPLWNYNGELADPENNIEDAGFRKKAVTMVQMLKSFYEIYSSNLAAGPEAEWKRAIDNLVGFPEEVTAQAVATHLDYYKTDFELSNLLSTLGFINDATYGRSYPKSVVPYSIILINRPEHWVTEDIKARGTVLDSLTQGTDAIQMMDSYNYFRPLDNLHVFKTILPKLATLFPQIDVELEEEEFEEFPELELPATDDPEATATEYHQSAAAAMSSGDIKKALLDKRIEVALLEQVSEVSVPHLVANLLEFTEWCLNQEKTCTAQEYLAKLDDLVPQLDPKQITLQIKFHQLNARLFAFNGDNTEVVNAINNALALCNGTAFAEQGYELANNLGIAQARMKQNEAATEAFQRALQFATQAQKGSKPGDAKQPRKYWPALVRALNRRIDALQKLAPAPANEDALQKIE